MIREAPTVNRYVEEAENERQYQLHLQAIKKMKPSINTHQDTKIKDKNPRVRIFNGQPVKKASRTDKIAENALGAKDTPADFDIFSARSQEDHYRPYIPTKSEKATRDNIEEKVPQTSRIPLSRQDNSQIATNINSKKRPQTAGMKKKPIEKRIQAENSSRINTSLGNSSPHTETPNTSRKNTSRIESARSDLSTNSVNSAKIESARRETKKISKQETSSHTETKIPSSSISAQSKQRTSSKKESAQIKPSKTTEERRKVATPKTQKQKCTDTLETNGKTKLETGIMKTENKPENKTETKIVKNVTFVKEINKPETEKPKMTAAPAPSFVGPAKVQFGADMWDTSDEDDDDDDTEGEDSTIQQKVQPPEQNEEENFVCSDSFASDNDF